MILFANFTICKQIGYSLGVEAKISAAPTQNNYLKSSYKYQA